MRTTEHAATRMNQRAITGEMIDLAMAYGDTDGDRIILSVKSCREIIENLKREQKKLEHAMKKGGITVVNEADAIVTVFRANSFSIGKAKKGRV